MVLPAVVHLLRLESQLTSGRDGSAGHIGHYWHIQIKKRFSIIEKVLVIAV